MTEHNRIVNVKNHTSHEVISRRTHRFADCSMLLDGGITENLTEREAGLLGIAECKVCVKRADGGPALAALTDIMLDAVNDLGKMGTDDFHAETAARHVLDELKKRGFYLSQRSPKEQS